MWIEIKNPAVESMRLADHDEVIEFTKNGKAQVTKQVGKDLTDKIDGIGEIGSENAPDDPTENDTQTD